MPRTEKIARNLKRLADEAKDKQALLENHPEYFRLDHPDQAQIHQDCQSLHKKLSLFQEQDLKNALELLLTFYCKSGSIPYISGLHEILAPFFVLRFTTLKTVYGAFSAFIDKMMPRLFTKDSSISYSYKIFQRLLLYHDPLLSNTLQSTLPNNSSIIEKWFYTCMSACLDITQLLEFWEWCLNENNPMFPYYFAIALLMKNRDLLTKKHKKKINLEIHIADNDELTAIIDDAQALQSSTPKFFNRLIKKLTIQKELPSSLDAYSLENTQILPISAKEVRKPKPGFFVIDVRRHKYYEQGHFPQSYNLSVDLHISTAQRNYEVFFLDFPLITTTKTALLAILHLHQVHPKKSFYMRVL
ncbi:TBC1D23_1 [Blepharisma stoltei]|uniref:Rab-GAP TBC domain-containing protein n=1 Tax=Blepharisma stoltei TaxID=1481888 RepID=A0AAU9I6Q2_9CILI|nr:unnamed protein product [Blepharisma stoltei]